MNKIMDVEILENFQLRITFLDGKKGVLKLNKYSSNEIFKNTKNFENFGLKEDGSIEWYNGYNIKENDIKELIL